MENSPPWYWRLEAGAREGGEGHPCNVTPRPSNKPHGAELVPSPPRAAGAVAHSDGSSLYSFNVPKRLVKPLLYYKT